MELQKTFICLNITFYNWLNSDLACMSSAFTRLKLCFDMFRYVTGLLGMYGSLQNSAKHISV